MDPHPRNGYNYYCTLPGAAVSLRRISPRTPTNPHTPALGHMVFQHVEKLTTLDIFQTQAHAVDLRVLKHIVQLDATGVVDVVQYHHLHTIQDVLWHSLAFNGR